MKISITQSKAKELLEVARKEIKKGIPVLNEYLEKGIISQEEFDNTRKQIVSKTPRFCFIFTIYSRMHISKVKT